MRAAMSPLSRQIGFNSTVIPITELQAANEVDVVDMSAFAPSDTPQGSEALVQILLLPSDRFDAVPAGDVDPDNRRSVIVTLAVTIEHEQEIAIRLDAGFFDVDVPLQRVVWRGTACACQFFVAIPEDAEASSYPIEVVILGEDIAIGSLGFRLRVLDRNTRSGEMVIRGDRARRLQRSRGPDLVGL